MRREPLAVAQAHGGGDGYGLTAARASGMVGVDIDPDSFYSLNSKGSWTSEPFGF